MKIEIIGDVISDVSIVRGAITFINEIFLDCSATPP
jgi:hypothetical protein